MSSKEHPVKHGYDLDPWDRTYASMFNNDEALVKRFMYLDQEAYDAEHLGDGREALYWRSDAACDDDEDNEQAIPTASTSTPPRATLTADSCRWDTCGANCSAAHSIT